MLQTLLVELALVKLASAECVGACSGTAGVQMLQRQTERSSALSHTHPIIGYEYHSPHCPPHFQTLWIMAGSRGDLCGGDKRDWTCPRGCVPMTGGVAPWCVEQNQRDACKHTHERQTHGCHWPLNQYDTSRYSSMHGVVCRKDPWLYNPDASWFQPPYGCETRWFNEPIWETSPWTVNASDPTKPCRVSLPMKYDARSRWKLVATNTHGAEVSVEVGISRASGSSASGSVSRSETQTLTESMSVGVGFEIPFLEGALSMNTESSVTTETSEEFTRAAERTVETVMTWDEVHVVTINCPDATKGGQQDKVNPDSVAMEYVYQFMVSNGEVEAKTEHFRCHQVADGKEHQPQCPPQYCGDPATNPYCKKDGVGSDARCRSR